MKSERAIIIKNPRFIKIRNELRALLKLWVWDEINSAETQKEKSKLGLMESMSICFCLHCGNRDKDMIYRPDMKQWLCVECNSEFVYFAKLRRELQMNIGEVYEFFRRLEGEEGVGLKKLPRSNSKCGGQSYPLSKKILNGMGINQEVQDKFLKLCQYYGGFCDCEIVLNAMNRFI